MTTSTELTNANGPVTLDTINQLRDSQPVFTGQYPTSPIEIAEVKSALKRLRETPSKKELSKKILTLLSVYYVKDLPKSLNMGIAEMWIAELGSYPLWAIDAACRWWVSRHNKRRHKTPLPGDISERAEEEMDFVRTGEAMVARYAKYGDSPPEFLKKA